MVMQSMRVSPSVALTAGVSGDILPPSQILKSSPVHSVPSGSENLYAFYSRRALLGLAAALAANAPAVLGAHASANNSPLGGEAANAFSRMFPVLPPQPTTIPRRRLGQSFAVLLMRSGYDVADALDFVPMDAFQRDFWLRRSSEWQPYQVQYSPLHVTQGDLTDPLYFDFISAIQFTTVSTRMRNGQQVFKEYCEECEDGTKLITRDPKLQDNANLPGLFERQLGDVIYRALREGFQGTQFDAPPPLNKSSSFEDVIAGVEKLQKVLVDSGYALAASVSDVDSGNGKFSVRLEGPATAWGMQANSSWGSNLLPAYDVLVVAAFIRTSGRQAQCSLAWSTSDLREAWTVDT